MPHDEAAKLFAECCGSSRWVEAMSARRPFGSKEAVLVAATDVCQSLDANDWLEAFAHHPTIGERGSALSAREQSGIDGASDTTRAELAAVNRDYEKRFGFIYIVCATGKTADDMLALARERIGNDRDTEIKVASEEQKKIIHLRLEKLLVEAP